MYESLKDLDLENQHLHYLRIIGKEIGVRTPTALRKDKLIEEIRLIMNGERTAVFSSRGRPTLNTRNTKYDDEVRCEQLKKIFDDFSREVKLAEEKYITTVISEKDKMYREILKLL